MSSASPSLLSHDQWEELNRQCRSLEEPLGEVIADNVEVLFSIYRHDYADEEEEHFDEVRLHFRYELSHDDFEPRPWLKFPADTINVPAAFVSAFRRVAARYDALAKAIEHMAGGQIVQHHSGEVVCSSR